MGSVVKICMVTPHLPPDQAANALLPQLLHDNLVKRGHKIRLMTFAPHSEKPRSEGVYYVHRPRSGWLGIRRVSQAITMLSVLQRAKQAFEDIDVVHIHSNTFMNQVVAAFAYFRRIPFVLTHYGTR